MSDPALSTLPTSKPTVTPWAFLAGFVIGLAALSVFGHRLAYHSFHPGFNRFTVTECPQGSYYPTLDEMKAIVRSRCRKDQVLVLVGGNSILLGVWQPETELWTRHLQEDLGDQYCVVNFAYRGASPTDAAGFVAEALRKEYPHMIYITNTSPFTGLDALGQPVYRWIFWQAYMDGDLEPLPARSVAIRQQLFEGDKKHLVWEEVITDGIDRFLRYKNLWNYVGFNYVFSASSMYGEAPPEEFRPRKSFPDTEVDALDPAAQDLRYPASSNEVEMNIVRGQILPNRFTVGADGRKRVIDPVVGGWSGTWPRLIPADMQPRYLLLLSEESPFYRSQLTADESALYQQVFRDARDTMNGAGINTVIYGENWQDEDFGDRSHLSKLGGAKLAAQITPEIKAMAQRLHYLP